MVASGLTLTTGDLIVGSRETLAAHRREFPAVGTLGSQATKRIFMLAAVGLIETRLPPGTPELAGAPVARARRVPSRQPTSRSIPEDAPDH